MWRPDHKALGSEVSRHFGIAFVGMTRPATGGYPGVEIRPADAHPNEGFTISVELGWRSLKLEFRPGPFAGPLIAEMGAASKDARRAFVRLAEGCASHGGQVTLAINELPFTVTDHSDWPDAWRSLTLGLRRTPAIVNTDDAETNEAEVLSWLIRFTGLALALLPVERLEEAVEPNPDGLPEGASVSVWVNRYERSRINRANCLAIHGTRCKACELDLGEAYGRLGEGFIHVHHIVPVSQIGAGYFVDPLTDLVPLCPNCHAISHRSSPPASVDQLKAMMAARRSNGAGRRSTGQSVPH